MTRESMSRETNKPTKCEKQANDDGFELTKGYLFHNKLEPLKFLHLFLGLRSYRKDKSHFSNVPWWMKTYIHTLSILQIFVLVAYNISIVLEARMDNFICKLAALLMFFIGGILIIMTWTSNANTKYILKIIKNFDIIERAIPEINSFPHSNNTLNIAIHVFFGFIFIGQTYYFHVIYLGLYQFGLLVWEIINDIAIDYALYQFCIMLNMTSSYINVLNSLICEIYRINEYNYDQREPIMIFVKNNVFQYGTPAPFFTNTKEFQITTLKNNDIVKIYNILMNNLELTNQKYNNVVSR